jgi:membrane protein DedA with SNARE-associated domain
MTFLETSASLGFLVPGESMVVIAGLLASRGVLELGDVICGGIFLRKNRRIADKPQ